MMKTPGSYGEKDLLKEIGEIPHTLMPILLKGYLSRRRTNMTDYGEYYNDHEEPEYDYYQEAEYDEHEKDLIELFQGEEN